MISTSRTWAPRSIEFSNRAFDGNVLNLTPPEVGRYCNLSRQFYGRAVRMNYYGVGTWRHVLGIDGGLAIHACVEDCCKVISRCAPVDDVANSAGLRLGSFE